MRRPAAPVTASSQRGEAALERVPRTTTPASGLQTVATKRGSDAAALATRGAKSMLGALRANLARLRDAVARGANRNELDAAVSEMEASLRRLDEVVRDAVMPRTEEDGALRPDRAPVNVGSVLQAVYHALRMQAAVSEVRMEVRIRSDADAKLDRRLVERALSNLLDNAMRFAPRGSTVRIDCDVVDEVVEIAVSDEGPSLDEAHAERVFEPYFTTATGTFPGEPVSAGQGLAFCRAVARAHGGDVHAAPSETGGRFVMTLPLER
jgi:signal transduction histidine kinase